MPSRTARTTKTKAAGKPVKAKSVRALKAKGMGKREANEFKKLLQEERARLLEELETMEEHIPDVEEQVGMDIGGSYDEDLADVASDTFEREKGLALESTVQQMLAQVEDALARIGSGSYGICQRCGGPIDHARLRAIPYAKLCIRCKELEERTNSPR